MERSWQLITTHLHTVTNIAHVKLQSSHLKMQNSVDLNTFQAAYAFTKTWLWDLLRQSFDETVCFTPRGEVTGLLHRSGVIRVKPAQNLETSEIDVNQHHECNPPSVASRSSS